jgi:hypothetical protein
MLLSEQFRDRETVSGMVKKQGFVTIFMKSFLSLSQKTI